LIDAGVELLGMDELSEVRSMLNSHAIDPIPINMSSSATV
jgi:hypothetical protein